MQIFSADYLRTVGIELFTAVGAPADEAAIVADELVNASLMGLDSHGVMRYIWYAEQALAGKIIPGAPTRIVKETPTTAIVDCGFNFGPVSATRMADILCAKVAISNMASVVSHNSHHVGRLGSYPQKVAERGFFCLATCNSSKHGHWVVPWGGREGRLATNPLAFAAPTSGQPVVLDMSTSMIAEGKVRILMHQGKPVPPGCVQDADGNPSTDPKAFYGPPRGTIRPFGSELGYKGFGLGLLVEIMSGLLAGMNSTEDLPYINGLCLMAVNPDAFCGRERFIELMDDLSQYMTTTPTAPGYDEVVMPGTLDYRTREQRLAEGIPVAEETWQQIRDVASRAGVTVDAPTPV